MGLIGRAGTPGIDGIPGRPGSKGKLFRTFKIYLMFCISNQYKKVLVKKSIHQIVHQYGCVMYRKRFRFNIH